MKNSLVFALVFALAPVAGKLAAQNQRHPLLEASRIPPRVEDHFWRRKVVNRIDLEEKINSPLKEAEVRSIYGPDDYASFGERDGIVMALINGLKSGKYLAYHPDSLQKALTYDEVVKWSVEIDQKEGGGDSNWGDGEGGDEFDAGGDAGADEFGMEGGDEFGDEMPEGDTPPGGGKGDGEFDTTPFETVIEFIEDRIFDKNRSDMVYDIQYIRLVWVDVSETLPDKNFVCFRYSDVLDTMEDTQWKNKFNDAEYRNLREIFELRMFNSVIYNVSGRESKTLEEADFRRSQLVEFEHHLWQY